MRYVDLRTRDELVAYYADDPAVDTDSIPTIHYWLDDPGSGTRRLTEAVTDRDFDFVVASHVIEHVPDLIGWLGDVAELLRDDGALLLAIPDRRFSFDALRPASSVGQALAAFVAEARVPDIAAVYDQNRNHIAVEAADIWTGRVPGRQDRTLPLAYVEEKVEEAKSGRYVDTHVWTMTPGEFVGLVEELGELGLVDFRIDALVPTPWKRLEFYAVLRRQHRGMDETAAATQRLQSVDATRRTLPEEASSAAHHALMREHKRLQARLGRRREELKKARADLRRERRRNSRLKKQLADLAQASPRARARHLQAARRARRLLARVRPTGR